MNDPNDGDDGNSLEREIKRELGRSLLSLLSQDSNSPNQAPSTIVKSEAESPPKKAKSEAPDSDEENNCKLCDFTSKDISVLFLHYDEDHCIFFCMLCEMTCASKFHLSVHLEAAHPKLFTDQKGFSVARIKSELLYTYSSGELLPYTCKICNHKVGRIGHINSHLRVHTGAKDFKCDYCDYRGTLKEAVKSHVRWHHSNLSEEQLRPVPCDICKKRFRNRASMQKHKMGHNNERPFTCEQCVYKCRTITQLKGHVLDKHCELSPDVLKPYQCEICEMRFKSPSHLNRHHKIHLKDVLKAYGYECEHCEKSFTEGYNLKQHVETVHLKLPEKKKHVCETCGAGFPRKGELLSHQLQHNPDAVLHKCDKCKFESKYPKSYKRHMALHEKSKNDSADGQKGHKCSTCFKEFPNGSKLKRHEQSHLSKKDRKTFKCEHCSMKSTEKSHLKVHMRNVHPDIMEDEENDDHPASNTT